MMLVLVADPLIAAIAKSVPVAFNATLCVLLGALSWTFNNALCCPLAVGANANVNRQLSPAARLALHVDDSVNGVDVLPVNPLMAVTPGL